MGWLIQLNDYFYISLKEKMFCQQLQQMHIFLNVFPLLRVKQWVGYWGDCSDWSSLPTRCPRSPLGCRAPPRCTCPWRGQAGRRSSPASTACSGPGPAWPRTRRWTAGCPRCTEWWPMPSVWPPRGRACPRSSCACTRCRRRHRHAAAAAAARSRCCTGSSPRPAGPCRWGTSRDTDDTLPESGGGASTPTGCGAGGGAPGGPPPRPRSSVLDSGPRTCRPSWKIQVCTLQ